MKNVGIYVRVSTLDQDYQRQISDIQWFINKHYTGEQINVEIYNEKISGYKGGAKRPQLETLLTKFRADKKYYDCIFVTELSRLGRNPTQTRVVVNELLENKVDICVTSSNGGTFFLNADKSINKTQLAVFQLLMEWADIEADQFKSRSKSGRRQKILEGGSNGGTYKLYGYKGVDKKMIIDEIEAVIVRQVFNDYKNGIGLGTIAMNLNQQGVLTRSNAMGLNDGASWDARQVQRILLNKIYCGVRTFNRFTDDPERIEEFETPELAIVTKELFDECTDLRLNKKGRRRNFHTQNVVLLQYLMKCGNCGRNYSHIVTDQNQLYCCTSRIVKPFKNCGNSGVSINLLDSAIYDMLCKTPAILEYLNDTEQIKKDVQEKITLIETTLPPIQKELEKFAKRLDKLYDDYNDDLMTKETYLRRRDEYLTQQKNISDQVDTQTNQLRQNKQTLVELNKPSTNTKILIEAKNDRIKLQSIYKQIIKSVTVYKLTPSLTRCDIKLQIAGRDVPHTLVVVIPKRINVKTVDLKYKTFLIKDPNPSEVADEDYYNVEYYDETKYLNIKDWLIVDQNYKLNIKNPTT